MSTVHFAMVNEDLHLIGVVEQQVSLFVFNSHVLAESESNGLCLVGNGVDVEVAVVGDTKDVLPTEVDNAAIVQAVRRIGAVVGTDAVQRLVHSISNVCLIPLGTVDLLRH
jgi:hypothetical protein